MEIAVNCMTKQQQKKYAWIFKVFFTKSADADCLHSKYVPIGATCELVPLVETP